MIPIQSVLFGLLLLALTAGARCQEVEGGPGGSAAPSVEAIKADAASVAARSDLSDEVKTSVQQSYDAALALLEAAGASDAKAEAFRESIQTAPEAAKIAAAEAGTIELSPNKETLVTAEERSAGIAEQKATLAGEEGALSQDESRLKEVETALDVEAARPTGIAEESVQAAERERVAIEALAALSDAASPAEVAERVRLRAEVAASRARLAALEQESASAPARLALLQTQRDLLARKVARGKARTEALQALVRAGVEEVATAAEQLVGEPGDVAPGTVEAEIAALSADLRAVADRISSARRDGVQEAAKLAELEADYALVIRQIEATGGGGAAAQVLLDRRRTLPDSRRLRRDHKARSSVLSGVRLDRIKADASLERMKVELVAEGDQQQKLVEAKRAVLEQLSEQYGQLIEELGEVDLAKQAYVEKLEQFSALLDEKLFWVRSSPPLGIETFTQLPGAVNWVAGPARAARASWAFRSVLSQAPVAIGGLALLAVVLWLLRPRMRRHLATYLPKIRRISGDRYSFTLEALGLVLLISVPFSLLIWAVGRQLLFIPKAGDWTLGIGHGLLRGAIVLFAFMFVREMCAKDGLAEAHFKWKRPITARLRKAATWLALLYVPATVVLLMAFTEGTGQYVHSFGRLVFIAAMIWLLIWLVFTLHPKRGIFAGVMEKNPSGLFARLRYLWFSIVLLGPLFLIVLATLGYLITALTLSGYLHSTVAIGVGAVVGYFLMLRFFTIRERKIALERTLAERKARREAAALAAGKEGAQVDAESEAGEESGMPDAEKEALDLAHVGMQTRRMLRAVVISLALGGLWLVWADALPALRTLDTNPVVGSATIADLILALIVAIATAVVAKNLPGILEIAVLRQLPLAGGSRYAVAALAQYILVAIGLFIIIQILPVDWSQLGWMVAALSVGLGFGLQEIVANFVCGIIILFERPIRVGDVVTVANVSGTVTRIRLRATTITDWDRKEFVVPNKEFITGQVLNWTLSNTTNRLVLNVGIAYGSDTERAKEILLEILRAHPDLLTDPGPAVTFESLGDSSLNFTVRTYLPNLDRRLGVTHELLTSIHKRFNEEGIEIPFPQRDLHVRSGWGGDGDRDASPAS